MGVLTAAKHWELGADVARALVAHEPSAGAWLRLARSEWRAGNSEEAQGCLKTSLTLNDRLRLNALDESDLDALWRNIGKL